MPLRSVKGCPPLTLRTGRLNRSSAHSAPQRACAKETVSCNDECHVLALTCAHCSALILDDDNDGFRKRHKWTTADRRSGAPRQEVRNTF